MQATSKYQAHATTTKGAVVAGKKLLHELQELKTGYENAVAVGFMKKIMYVLVPPKDKAQQLHGPALLAHHVLGPQFQEKYLRWPRMSYGQPPQPGERECNGSRGNRV